MIFELFDEDTAGLRTGVLAEPQPQERVQRHTMEHIVDFVCCAPMVQILGASVPQTVEQLPDVLRFFDRFATVPEQVIAVPKISLEDVPFCAVLCDPQLVEQLVEVPTVVCYSSLLQRTGAARRHSRSWSWRANFGSSRFSSRTVQQRRVLPRNVFLRDCGADR